MLYDILQTIYNNKIYWLNIIYFVFLFLLLLLVYFVCQVCLISIIRIFLSIIIRIPVLNNVFKELPEIIERQTFPFSLLKSRIFFILLSVPLISYCYLLLPINIFIFPLHTKKILLFSTLITWLFTFLTFSVTLPFEKSSKIAFHSSILSSLIISIVIYCYL